jgi:hypothetical protein
MASSKLGEDLFWVFVFLVEPLGIFGCHTSIIPHNFASRTVLFLAVDRQGFLPARIRAAECVDITRGVVHGVEDDDDRIVPDTCLDERSSTTVGIVIPHVRKSQDAHDRIQHVVCVQLVPGRQLTTRSLADNKSGNPQGLGHTETLEVDA